MTMSGLISPNFFEESDSEKVNHLKPISEPKVIQMPVTTVKVNRNDPGPCGSGKKYKKCCGQG
jgi:uncharacterized protein YecA (UPF0149 family)